MCQEDYDIMFVQLLNGKHVESLETLRGPAAVGIELHSAFVDALMPLSLLYGCICAMLNRFMCSDHIRTES